MRSLFALGTVLLLALAPAIDAAGSRTATATYHGSGDFVTGSFSGVNVGGATFASNAGDVSVLVEIYDDVGGNLLTLNVCQDFNDDGFCGDAAAGEPSVVGCGAASLTAEDGFEAGFDVTVFVQGAGFLFVEGACPDFAPVTTGTLTATFTTA